MNQLQQIYKYLFRKYGKQFWWPLSKGNLETKHHNGKPETDLDKFEIIVGAILTQNTTWTNVEKAIFNLNKAKILDPKKMAITDEKKIGELIKPAGYFNQKAKRIKFMAEYFIKNPDFLNKEIPELRKKLLAINGIGPETADSIILYAAQKPSFVIDTYTKRIFSRLLNKNFKTYDEWKCFFENNLEKDTKMFNEYHALIVEHAKRHCKTKPECNGCILSRDCSYYKSSASKF